MSVSPAEVNMPSVVITGTSTGIGWNAAKVLIDNGFRVFGSVRKQSDAERLAADFGPRFVPLIFDVTDEAAVRAAAREVDTALGGETLVGLVNNAGVASAHPLLTLPIADFRRQVEVNLLGAVIAIQAFAPLLGTDAARRGKPGRIVNISSVNGRIGTPFLAAYSASKFAMEGFSEALRRELLPFGIDVIVIAPGPVATPIWTKAEAMHDDPSAFTAPYATARERMQWYIERGKRALPPERVGQLILRALTTPRPRVRYAISPEWLVHWLARIGNQRLIDFAIGKMLGFPASRRASKNNR